MVLPIAVWMACGQVYRPVVIPCSTGGVQGCPVQSNPNPTNFHAVFGITTNSPNYPGGAMQIDVSGDSILAETPTSDPSKPNLGTIPTHAVISPTNSRVFVASAGSLQAGGVDNVSFFTPVFQSTTAAGFSTVSTISLPSLSGQSAAITGLSESGNVVTATLSNPLLASPVLADLVAVGTQVVIANAIIPNCSPNAQPACNSSAYDGTFVITAVSSTTIQYVVSATGLPAISGGTASIPGQPDYLASTESNEVYVANFNSNSVLKVNTITNVVVASTSLEPAAVTPSPHPVSMAEMPNALKLYVANQGNDTVSSLNTVDLSANPLIGFTGTAPVWVVARGDNQKVYVLTQGDGQLATIDTATDTVTSSLPVGVGANFMAFDANLNRIYVTNPVAQMVYVFSDTGGLINGLASDVPDQLAAIDMTAAVGGAKAPCPTGCAPVSVTALADGSRFYVASYQRPSACPDANVSGACVVPYLTIFNAKTFAPQYPAAPTLTLLSPTGGAPFAATQYAVAPVASCETAPLYPTLYSPGATRFRVFTKASVDGSRVYVSLCDAGAVAVINTTDSNANNPGTLNAPDSLVLDLAAAPSDATVLSNGQQAPQNPMFLFTGQ
jgi:YVTN family beta-propeller protein